MEGERRSQRGVSLLLAMLFVFSTFPGVQAQAGEVLFEEASLSIVDYTSFEGEDLPFSVELHELSGGLQTLRCILWSPPLRVLNSQTRVRVLSEFQGT